MQKYLQSIDRQIAHHQGENIFLDQPGLFQFMQTTLDAIPGLDQLDETTEKLLVDYATDKALEAFCRQNQYYSFDTQAKAELRSIYAALFKRLRDRSEPAEALARDHYQRLRSWLSRTNPFAEQLYRNAEAELDPVACAEYSATLQMDLLRIDPDTLLPPVLDIGCGQEGRLVRFLNEQGIEAFGFDRFRFSTAHLVAADWLEYDYGVEKWGTIISNLAFSNHFIHHNLRPDGNYIAYGNTYMRILNALRPGGTFHYAPDLPFIEKYLNNRQFAVAKYPLAGVAAMTTMVKRLL